ncbi:Putative transmembrane protein (PGPGW) [Nitrosomonas marina]|uniref:Putative transmembrane protein (PGPGW) n=1 Tax=Nitrosomonas marina TaxID=917 RepID=A0A1I0BQQ0_9PROT|nr:PGPGW domain-containing protein [Nitrosomonas marina]SET08959.1 Putative transmembrane protein (PGPGW) [Nitrosomonas marina]
MDSLLAAIEQWIPVDVLIHLTIISLISFIASLVLIPIILIRLPYDYFDISVPRYWMKNHHPILRIFGLIAKNLLGGAFLIAGFIMLFLPGQGILTMLIGLSFVDFPKKRLLEARIIEQPVILRTINAMRQRYKKPPLIL